MSEKLKIGMLISILVFGLAFVACAADTPATVQFAKLQWVPLADTWKVTDTGLSNSALDSTNTDVYADLNQQGNILTYSWKVRFNETGSSTSGPMTGLHILVDNPTDINRGNSLLIWQEKTMMRIYQAINGAWNTKQRYDVSGLSAAPGETHSYRLVVDVKANQVTLYRDDAQVGQWIPPFPLSTGNYVSIRTNKTLSEIQSFSFNAQ